MQGVGFGPRRSKANGGDLERAVGPEAHNQEGGGELEFVGGASLSARARDVLLRAILRHQFPEGRLPAEDELARQLGVSRTTIRTALHSLEEHGVVKRTPGLGTSVHERMSPSVVALQRLIGFADLIREQGHEVTYTPSMRVTEEPGEVVSEALGLAPGTPCFEIQRLLFADRQPAVWAVDVFPTSTFARELEFNDVTSVSNPFDIPTSLFVEPIDHAVVQLIPHAAGDELVEKLGLAPTQPCILLREVFYSESGAAIGFSAIHVNDRFVRFELIRRRERS
jgi:GntR family transcriptional regulator